MMVHTNSDMKEIMKDVLPKIYDYIKQNNGNVATDDLVRLVGNRETVRYAINRLTNQGRIMRIKKFIASQSGVVYRYKVIR